MTKVSCLPGGSVTEQAWLNAAAGQPGYLAGPGAQAAACDALMVPVVTGHADLAVIDQIIELTLTAAHHGGGGHGTSGLGSDGADGAGEGGHGGGTGRPRSRPLSPAAWAALRSAIARLAIEFLSGPNGLAAQLRTGLLPAPCNTPSLPLDIGYSDAISGHIRRAVQLRDRHCAWPLRPPRRLLHGTTTASGPHGQQLHSHLPPTARAG